MKPGDIISTPKGPALYLGGDTKDINNYKLPVTSGLPAAGLQGLTWRYYDEVVGTVRGAIDPTITAQQGRQLERAAFEKVQKEQPGAAIAAEIVGAAIPSLFTLGATAPVSATGILQAGLRAAPAGAIYGAGGAEGYTERVGPAIATGLTAGVGGSALQVLARPFSNLTQMVKSSLIKPEVAGKKEAQKLVKEALDFDKTDINKAIQYITERSGKQYALADIGPNTRAYLDAVNVLPGKGKKEAQDFLKKRNEGMLNRITGDLQDAFGAKASYFETYKALESARSANGKILYSKAMEKKIPVNEELVDILRKPSASSAFEKAYIMAAEDGIKLPRINLKNGKMFTDKGKEVKAIDTQLLHYMKLSLDDSIYTSRSPLSGVGATELGLKKKTKNDFLNYIDKNNKTYKRARDEWSGTTSIMDALDRGRKFDAPSINVEELSAEIAKMSKSELEAFRNGVLNRIVENLENKISYDGRGANLALEIIKKPKNRRLLRQTFPPTGLGTQQYKKFMSNLNDEIEMKDTSNVVIGNSATAGRQEAVSRIRGVVSPSEVQNLSPVGLFYTMLKADSKEMSDRAASSAASELARILTETNPTALKQIAKEIESKKTFKGILKNYLPTAAERIVRAPISPQVVAAESNVFGQYAPRTPSIQELTDRLLTLEE